MLEEYIDSMNDPQPGYKSKALDIKSLLLFFLIAFGWTWFWWSLFITGVLHMPPTARSRQRSGNLRLWILARGIGPSHRLPLAGGTSACGIQRLPVNQGTFQPVGHPRLFRLRARGVI